MGRIASAIWATIGAFGYIATLGPVQSGSERIQAMRGIAITAVVIAGIVLVIPWSRLSRNWFSLILGLMSLDIGALAYAGGAERGDLALLFTFIAIFAAYFLSWRVTIGQLSMICVILGARLFDVGDSDLMKTEALRLALLLPALVVVATLVSILRSRIDEREAQLDSQLMNDHQTGLLTPDGLSQVLDRELARASRHARPLALILLEVSGPGMIADPDNESRITTTIARALLARIRAEDYGARLGDLRFAVVAMETGFEGGSALGTSIREQIRKRLVTLGYEANRFSIEIGCADFPRYPDGGPPKEGLIKAAEDALVGTVPSPDSAEPCEESSASPPRPAARSR